ncbi:MAG: trigger factor [Acetomicrobium sp.]
MLKYTPRLFHVEERSLVTMRSELISQEKNIVKIKVEVEPERFEETVKDVIKEISQKANIKGFRKGRVPRNVIELYFGRESIYREALENLIPEVVTQIKEEYGLELIAEPRVKLEGEVKEGSPVLLEIEYEVVPEIELPDLSQIEVPKLKPIVTDEMVEQVIKDLRERNAEHVDVEEERPIEENDIVVVNATAQVEREEGDDIEKFDFEGKEVEDTIDLTADYLDENVKKDLVGQSAGSTITTTITHPDDGSKLAGKRITYTMEVKGIKKKILPELDEEFLKKVGADGKDLDEFKTHIKEQLQDVLENRAKNEAINLALQQIVNQTKIDVPERLVDREFQSLLYEEEQRIKQAYNITLEEYVKQSGIDFEEYKKKVRDQAFRRVLNSLVLEELTKRFEIKVDPGDIRSHVERMATAYNLSAEELSSFIVSDQDRLYKLSYDIMTEKTLDKILDFVNVRELEKEEYEKALKDLLEKMKAASAEQEETEESEQDSGNEARGGNEDVSTDSDRTDG